MDTAVEKSVKKVKELESINRSLEAENFHLKERLAWFERQVFGQKSERFIDNFPPEIPELPGLDIPENAKDKPEFEVVPEHKRRKNSKGKNQYKVSYPDTLDVEENIIDIPPEERFHPVTGEPLVEIDRDITDKLGYRKSSYYIDRTVTVKYAVKNNSLAGVVQCPVPDCIVTGSKFTPEFMAHVVTEKYAYHMPLYRIQEKLSAHAIKVERQTLSSLMINIGLKLMPLYDLMKEKLFLSEYLFTDDTTVNMLDPGNGKTKTTRIWIYSCAKPNAPPYQIYSFSPDRSHFYPTNFLKDFEGVIHADAYEAYVKLDSDENSGVTWAACWCHARRYFEDIKSLDLKLRNDILRKIRYLFMFERVAWKTDTKKRLKIRLEHEKKIVDDIFTMLKNKVREGELLPKSNLAKAIGYMLKHEKNFRLYLTDPNIRMENNTAERGLRKIVIGRKNWLFFGSKRAGEAAAVIYSLIQTCRIMGIEPFEYMTDIFKWFLGYQNNRLFELLPDNWAESKKSKLTQD